MVGVKIMKTYLSPDNKLYAYELDGSQDHLIPEEYVFLTELEAQAFRDAEEETARTAYLNSLTYVEKRAAEYPSFADQFDLLYHGGYDAWKAAIDDIKNKYPKG